MEQLLDIVHKKKCNKIYKYNIYNNKSKNKTQSSKILHNYRFYSLQRSIYIYSNDKEKKYERQD